MLKPIDPRRPLKLVHPSEEELPPGEATLWPIYGLTSVARRELDDRAFHVEQAPGGGIVMPRAGSSTYLRCKYGLGKPEGGPFEALWEGEDSPWVRGRQVPTDEFLDRIPETLLAWIASQVQQHAALSEADLGKSSPPSTSPSGTSTQTAAPADDPATKS